MQERIYTMEARYHHNMLVSHSIFLGSTTLPAIWLFTASHTHPRLELGFQAASAVCALAVLVCATFWITTFLAWRKAKDKAREKACRPPASDYPVDLIAARRLIFLLPQEERSQYPVACMKAVHDKLHSATVDLVCLSIGTGARLEAVLRQQGHILSVVGSDNLEFLAENVSPGNINSTCFAASEFLGNWEINRPSMTHAEHLMAWLNADDLATQTPTCASPAHPVRRL